jgi:betaine-aldehyde dehydrogenase
MFEPSEILIGNQWVRPATSARLPVVSPATQEVVGSVPLASTLDVDRAVASARLAFDTGPWPHLPVEERAAALRRVVAAFEPLQARAIELGIDEMGGTRKFLAGAVSSVQSTLERFIADVDLVAFREVRRGMAGDVLITREPIGVTAGISPWNGVLLAALNKIFPSLLMGCPMVVKLAPQAPLSFYPLAEAFVAAALPEGTLSVLAGGADAGEHLVGHPGVDLVSFTGSDAVGAEIASTCGRDIRRVVLELGGKSVALILDGDVSAAVRTIVATALRNVGQVCISTNRILVHEDQRDELLEQLSAQVAALKIGDPHDAETDIGPVVSAAQRDRVEGYIASAIGEGAKLVLGGRRPPGFEHGYYIEPTVFCDVDPSMRVAQEEIFGPVLLVMTYRDEDDAIAIANDSRFGLGGAVFSADVGHAVRVASRIRTGTCAINDAPPAGGGGPFGGYKRSGLGRERSKEGHEAYLEIKSISLPPGYSASAA